MAAGLPVRRATRVRCANQPDQQDDTPGGKGGAADEYEDDLPSL
jgi:hypothetical protein